MNIIIDLQPLIKKKTGIGWFTYYLNRNLAQINNRNIFLKGSTFDFLGMNKADEKLIEVNFDSLEINHVIPPKAYKLLWSVIPLKYDKLFKNGDLYHFYNYTIPPISDNKKVIINVYDLVLKMFPKTMKITNRKLLERELEKSVNRADRIVTISNSSKNEISETYGIDKKKIEIIYPGIDATVIEAGKMQKRGNPLNTKYFLFVGTVEPRKNLNTLIEAYGLLPDDVKNEYKLVICGGRGWGSNTVYDLVSRMGLEDRIIFTGYVSEERKWDLMNNAEIFIFPSIYEGFGMPAAEAMACGVPVIASDIGVLREVGGEAALYASPDDPDGFRNHIMNLLSDEKLRHEMVEAGILNISRFSWEAGARKLLRIYEEVANE